MRLFSTRSQRTSKCGKNISDTLGCASCATFVVICDLLLNRRKTTWNLLVKQTHAKMESIFKVLLSLKGFFSWRKPTKLQSLQPITYQTRSKDNWRQLEERITVSKSRFIKKSFRVAVLLFSDRFQTTSKRGEKETWHTRCSRVCHWCSCLFNQTVIYITSGLSVVILYLSRLTNFTSCPSWHPFTQLTQMA